MAYAPPISKWTPNGPPMCIENVVFEGTSWQRKYCDAQYCANYGEPYKRTFYKSEPKKDPGNELVQCWARWIDGDSLTFDEGTICNDAAVAYNDCQNCTSDISDHFRRASKCPKLSNSKTCKQPAPCSQDSGALLFSFHVSAHIMQTHVFPSLHEQPHVCGD